MKRTATAVWNGAGKDGTGTLSTQSTALNNQPYSAMARFESEDGTAGTNPEELIAAAHAGCFSMALAFGLSGAGSPPNTIRTQAVLSIEKDDQGWKITTIALHTEADVPGIAEADFQALAAKAKSGCPVSRALNAEITLEAVLV